MINTKLQNIIDTKSAIGNAIVNKGGTITSETPFYNYAAQIDNISTGSVLTGNATANQVFNGQTFYSNDANTQLTGNYVAPQIDGVDESFMPFIANFASFGVTVRTFTVDNGFLYIGGTSNIVRKYNVSTLELVGNTASYGGAIGAIAINNGFVYVGGTTNFTVQKFHESNLVFVENSPTYGQNINSIAINNGFVYVGGAEVSGTNRGVTKYYEGNLAYTGANLNLSSTDNFVGIQEIAINNGFIYAGNGSRIRKYDETTFEINATGPSTTATTKAIAINNGFVYRAGMTNRIEVTHESNMVAFANINGVGTVDGLTINNGFIYYTSNLNFITKLYESNLAILNSSAQSASAFGKGLVLYNNFLFPLTGQIVQKYQASTPFTNSLNGSAWYLIAKE
jgi:stage V sporulation protein SpoVS